MVPRLQPPEIEARPPGVVLADGIGQDFSAGLVDFDTLAGAGSEKGAEHPGSGMGIYQGAAALARKLEAGKGGGLVKRRVLPVARHHR